MILRLMRKNQSLHGAKQKFSGFQQRIQTGTALQTGVIDEEFHIIFNDLHHVVRLPGKASRQ
jgi:hypothetical protein